MVEIADIRDRESLGAWLRERSREDAVWIASRAAMRVLPLYWRWTFTDRAGKDELTALPILRCLLISSVATVRPTEDIRSAALAAAAAAAADADADAAAYTAAAAAAAAADAAAWNATRMDCSHLLSGNAEDPPSLWPRRKGSLASAWSQVRSNAIEPEWAFWIKWYQDALDGVKPDWDLLERIALKIKPDIWDAGPKPVAREIERFIEEASARKNAELFAATLFDFTLDKLAGVMRAIPMPADWKHLDDPDRLAPFLDDAADLREDMDLFADALAAEGAARQGAGAISKYLKAVLAELSRAENVGSLRVGKLMEYGRILERMCLAEETRREFGVLTEPLDLNVSKLRELIRNHFAYTLARFAVLRELRMESDASPWEVLREFRFMVDDVRTGANGVLAPLATEDAAVLVDVLDSVDAQIRALETTNNDDLRTSIRREIDFQLAKIAATGAVFIDRAKAAEPSYAKKADSALDWTKRGTGLWSIAKQIRDLFF